MLRRHFYELSAWIKIRPRCWWGKSLNTPTSSPEFLFVNPKTILPSHWVLSSGLQHNFHKIWFFNMIAADLFCTMIVKWTRDVYTAIGTIISVLSYFLAIQCTNEDKIFVPKVYYFHWYQRYQKQDWKWQNRDFRQKLQYTTSRKYIVVMLSFLKIFPFLIQFKFKNVQRFKQFGEVFLIINKFVLNLVNFKTK